MTVKKCLICGTEFKTRKPNKKYCSFSCARAAELVRKMKFREEHPDYFKEYMRNYRIKNTKN